VPKHRIVIGEFGLRKYTRPVYFAFSRYRRFEIGECWKQEGRYRALICGRDWVEERTQPELRAAVMAVALELFREAVTEADGRAVDA